MFYTIYKITNTTNGKFYIGKHQTLDLDDSYFGSGKALNAAIKKYGKDSFVKEILFIFDTEDEMNLKEKELVTEDFVQRSDTYNLGVGGEGGPHFKGKSHSEEVKSKIRNSVHGYVFTEEQRKKVSEAQVGKRLGDKNPQFGKFWITDGKINKLIRPDQFEQFQGFKRGRTLPT
jgi:group I intron endonuclease